MKFLYTPQAQEIEAKDFYRPRNPEILAKYKGQFPNIPLATIDGDFGGWARRSPPISAMAGLRPDLPARQVILFP